MRACALLGYVLLALAGLTQRVPIPRARSEREGVAEACGNGSTRSRWSGE